MELNKIKLKHFRNHKTLELEFDNKLTLIQGANGSGKTNILESIYLLSASKSNKEVYENASTKKEKVNKVAKS